MTALERVGKAVISVCKNDLKQPTDASYGCEKDKKTSWFSHILKTVSLRQQRKQVCSVIQKVCERAKKGVPFVYKNKTKGVLLL